MWWEEAEAISGLYTFQYSRTQCAQVLGTDGREKRTPRVAVASLGPRPVEQMGCTLASCQLNGKLRWCDDDQRPCGTSPADRLRHPRRSSPRSCSLHRHLSFLLPTLTRLSASSLPPPRRLLS